MSVARTTLYGSSGKLVGGVSGPSTLRSGGPGAKSPPTASAGAARSVQGRGPETPPTPVCVAVENRTAEAVTLAYHVHPTGERGSLVVPAGGTERFPPCDPRCLAFTNEAEVPHPKLPAAAADAIDEAFAATHGPGAPRWQGLAFRQEAAAPEDTETARTVQ